MDFVPSTAAVAAVAQKSPHNEATAPAGTKAVSPLAQVSLDPRPIYALAPGTADAVLSLADMNVKAATAANFEAHYGRSSPAIEATTAAASAPVVSPEPAKAVSASNRNWNEDVRLNPIPTRKIGTDLVVQYDNPKVMAAWQAAFPDITSRKYRGLTLADTNAKPDLSRLRAESGLNFSEKAIYLMCNSDNYKSFVEEHPHTKISWIAVDSEDILLAWPKDTDRKDGHSADGPEPVAREAESQDLISIANQSIGSTDRI